MKLRDETTLPVQQPCERSACASGRMQAVHASADRIQNEQVDQRVRTSAANISRRTPLRIAGEKTHRRRPVRLRRRTWMSTAVSCMSAAMMQTTPAATYPCYRHASYFRRARCSQIRNIQRMEGIAQRSWEPCNCSQTMSAA